MQKSILAADPYRIIKPDTTQLSRSPSDDRGTQGVTESVKTRRGEVPRCWYGISPEGGTRTGEAVTRGVQMQQGRRS